MNHDLFYLFKRRERIERNFHSSSIVVFLIMNNYYGNRDNGLAEARNIINQKSEDDLNKLMNSEDEIYKLIGNLNEV